MNEMKISREEISIKGSDDVVVTLGTLTLVLIFAGFVISKKMIS